MADIDSDKVKTELTAPSTQSKVVEVSVDTCWRQNYNEEIITPNPPGIYYQMYDQDENIMSGNFHERRYQLSICFQPVAPQGKGSQTPQSGPYDPMFKEGVTITFRVTEPEPGRNRVRRLAFVSEKDLAEAKIKCINAVKVFNNRFILLIKDPLCGEKKMPIYFVLNWVKSDAHFGVYVRENGDGAENSIYGLEFPQAYQSTEVAHELGHGLGMADEYKITIVRNRIPITRTWVRYIKPDGTLDEKIELISGNRTADDPLATLYSCMTCAILKKRHGWPMAIEIQKLLRQKIPRTTGKEISCDIELI